MFFRDGNVWSSYHSHLLDCEFFEELDTDANTLWNQSNNNNQRVQSPPKSLYNFMLNKDSRSPKAFKFSEKNVVKNERKDNPMPQRKRKKSMDAAVAKMTKLFKTRPLVIGNWRIGEGQNRWVLIKYVSKSYAKHKEERKRLFNKFEASNDVIGGSSGSSSGSGMILQEGSENESEENENSEEKDRKDDEKERGTKRRDTITNEDYAKYKEMKEEYNEKRRLFNENVLNGKMDWELYLEDDFSKLVFMVSPTGKLWTCCGGGGWFIKGTSNDNKFKNAFQSLDKKVQYFLPCMFYVCLYLFCFYLCLCLCMFVMLICEWSAL